jgi:hypothetical protein
MPKPILLENDMTQDPLTTQEPNWDKARRRITDAIRGFSGDETRLIESIFSDATPAPSGEHTTLAGGEENKPKRPGLNSENPWTVAQLT